MKTKILIMLYILFILTACKKNKQTEPVQELKTYLNKQIYSGLGTYTWNYDTQNRLKSVVFVSSNEASNPSNTYTVTAYDDNNNIVLCNIDYTNPALADYRYVQTYDANGKITSQIITNAQTNALSSSFSAIYSGNKVTNENRNSSGILINYQVYSLSTDSKNITKTEYFTAAGVLQFTYQFLNFDDKKTSTSLYPKSYSIAPQNANNYATLILTDNITGVSTTYTYMYEYDNNGYTTKRISNSGTTNSFEYLIK